MSKNKVYKTLNNWIARMIAHEAFKSSYLAYVHLYAFSHSFSDSAFYRLSLVVASAFPFEYAVATHKLNPTIESFFRNYSTFNKDFKVQITVISKDGKTI